MFVCLEEPCPYPNPLDVHVPIIGYLWRTWTEVFAESFDACLNLRHRCGIVRAVALPTFDIQNSDAEGRPEERSTGHRHLVTGTREHLVVNGFDLAIKYSD